jgi:hypothetical protein
MKKCLFCGKDFEPKNPKGKFCSDKCKMKEARAKIKELKFAKIKRDQIIENPTKVSGVRIDIDKLKSDIPFTKTTPGSYDSPKLTNPKDEYDPFDNWRFKIKNGIKKENPNQ